ncbi:MAG: HypC/HybG/HupF family hydrogenase formation chaperone [Candidatus Woesearchaeota archaeon]
MCLSIPGKVIKIDKNIATIDYGSEIRIASTQLHPEVKVGNYVIVSAKLIMEIVPKKDALKAIMLWRMALKSK